jgi:methionyl-tRNA synthetase
MRTVLWALAETLRHLAVLVQPFMPGSAKLLLDQLEIPFSARSFAALGPEGALRPGTGLPPPTGVFPRYQEASAA